MADNVTLNVGTGGSDLWTDEVAGPKHAQIVKLADGTADSTTVIASGGGVEAGALRVTVASDSTGVLSVDDNGGSLTIDGTVTANLSATDNAVLDSIDTAVNGTLTVGSHAVTNAGTFAVQADSLIPGVGATNLGKAEDAAHSSGDTGVMALGVRNDTLASLAGTDGDYAPLQVDATGALYVDFPDFTVDSGNSTTTPLAGGATFTGTGVDLSKYAGITVNLFADQDSASSGMRFQFSSDNSNWDINVGGGFDYLASTGRQFQFPCFAKYFRVVFVNGGTIQGAVRIQTLLHHHPIALTSVHRLDADVKPDRSAELVKSGLLAQVNGSGDFIPIQCNAGGILKTTGGLSEFAEDAAHNSGDTGAMMLAVRRDTAAVGSGTDGDYSTVNVDGSGRVWAHDPVAEALLTTIDADTGTIATNTTAAASAYRNIDANAEAEIKGSAGILHWLHVMNLTAAKAYLHLYDATAASVTPGTTTPTFTFPIPTQGDTNGAGFNLPLGPNGQNFANAITLVCTTTIDGSAGDPGANGVFVNAGYS